MSNPGLVDLIEHMIEAGSNAWNFVDGMCQDDFMDDKRTQPDALMLAIAQENNLAETAFVRGRQDGAFDLRWFAPAHEVDFRGHATLAAAHI